ncbi:hypothetical protein [Pararhodobacter aggregans]|uniref:hypothetical protein n=1 Tax=Pararhodobacter aggregans TaxID=404875 RepID=UPI0010576806|nr:hypothetical protein [Pararhodobacter aggregans]
MPIRITPYTPAEVAIATGRTVVNQRNDRRSGYAPRHHGHARFDLIGVARNYVIQSFAELGIGPASSVRFADDAGNAIARTLIRQPEAWSWAARSRYPGMGIGGRVVGVHRDLIGLLPFEYERPSIMQGLIVWANGDFEISPKFIAAPGSKLPRERKLWGPYVTMGFGFAGWALAERLPRPIFDWVEENEMD